MDTTTPKSDPASVNSAFRDAVGDTPVENIDAVIDRLTRIIDTAASVQSRLGYFPVLYRIMTVAVQEGIRDGRFENPELMERLDVVFANRYFSALRYQTCRPAVVSQLSPLSPCAVRRPYVISGGGRWLETRGLLSF